MTLTDLLTTQLTDVFRVGLIVALVATAFRTRPDTGLVMPLALGVIFVAAMIPMTIPNEGAGPLMRQIGVGLGANVILLVAALAIWTLIRRLRR